MKNILYIGRFQPFHKGHANAILQIFEKYPNLKKLYIGIGSAEDNYLPKNPLTSSERFQIIESALEELKIPAEKWAIVPIRNIDHYAMWTNHVAQYIPPFEIIASGSLIVQQLFYNADKKYEILYLVKNTKISATQIRNNYVLGKSSEEFLLNTTKELLDIFNFSERMRVISEMD